MNAFHGEKNLGGYLRRDTKVFLLNGKRKSFVCWFATKSKLSVLPEFPKPQLFPRNGCSTKLLYTDAHKKHRPIYLRRMEEAGDLIGEKLAPYNPTNLDAIDISIGLLKIQSNDIVYDLGCGDARFLVQVSARLRSRLPNVFTSFCSLVRKSMESEE